MPGKALWPVSGPLNPITAQRLVNHGETGVAQGRGPSRDSKHGVLVGSVEKVSASRKLCKTSELANSVKTRA